MTDFEKKMHHDGRLYGYRWDTGSGSVDPYLQ